jgi:hypothetical protein
MKIIKKITVKTVHGKKLDPFPAEDPIGTKRIVLTVWGRADSNVPGENTLPSGDLSKYNRFKGDFLAYPGEAGEGDKTRSGVMILPDVAGDLLANLLRDESVQSANFGFQIGIMKTETPIGYEYFAVPLIEEAADADPLAAIGKQVMAALAPPAAPDKAKAPAKVAAVK